MKNSIFMSLCLLIILNSTASAVGGAIPMQPRFLQLQNDFGDTVTIIEDINYFGTESETLATHFSDLEIEAFQSSDAMLSSPPNPEDVIDTEISNDFLETITKFAPKFVTKKFFSVADAKNYVLQKRNDALSDSNERAETLSNLEFSAQLNQSKRKVQNRGENFAIQSFFFISPQGFETLIEELEFPMSQIALYLDHQNYDIEDFDNLLDRGIVEAIKNRKETLEKSFQASESKPLLNRLLSKITRLLANITAR